MKILSSLRSRMFLASAVLAVLCIGMAVSLVSVRVTDEAERTIEREISATGAQVKAGMVSSDQPAGVGAAAPSGIAATAR